METNDAMEQLTKTGFDEEALAALPPTAPFAESIRKQAFQEFLAQPIPSQETEEWRYTDLEGFGFDLRPFVEGGRVRIQQHKNFKILHGSIPPGSDRRHSREPRRRMRAHRRS